MKPTIAFVTGGYSGESVISYKSAVNILKNVDREKYTVYEIDMRLDGWWYESPGAGRTPVERQDFSIRDGARKITFDAVLIGIHGTPGEDGKLQGYLDLINIPYTSCSAATSALTFNKRYTVAIASFAGIPVSKSVVLIKNRFAQVEDVVKELQFPVFVKPNNGGSSIGMSRVNDPSEELGAAIEKAFREDDQVLIEEYIEGREFTIGVFRSDGNIITLPFTEIKTKKEFFDFEAKYTPGFTEEITPAMVSNTIAEKVNDSAKKVYQIFNCDGVIRIDFIYNEQKDQLFLLEINTVPGQTDASIVPQQVRAMGWTLKKFYSALIEDALNRKIR